MFSTNLLKNESTVYDNNIHNERTLQLSALAHGGSLVTGWKVTSTSTLSKHIINGTTISLILQFVKNTTNHCIEIDAVLTSLRKKIHICEHQRNAAKRKKYRKRKSWENFQSNLKDSQFCRYFCMSRECFQHLAKEIEQKVGSDGFLSEQYIHEVKSGLVIDERRANIILAHEQSTGTIISGEVKLALTLHMLAGGSYLDLSLLYDMGSSTANHIFYQVIKDWILDNNLVKISAAKYIQDEKQMEDVALQYTRSSNGIICGCIGAIDGWIVKIARPTRKRDQVSNPSTYYSQKGYFGLNFQAIVNQKKKILFWSILSRGAKHYSTAFKNSKFYEGLMEKWVQLADLGFYFIGDSAYGIKSFLLMPYDNVCHGLAEDNYNFFHSSSRICVECVFGEID